MSRPSEPHLLQRIAEVSRQLQQIPLESDPRDIEQLLSGLPQDLRHVFIQQWLERLRCELPAGEFQRSSGVFASAISADPITPPPVDHLAVNHQTSESIAATRPMSESGDPSAPRHSEAAEIREARLRDESRRNSADSTIPFSRPFDERLGDNPPNAPQQLGDYELLEELGRGGMGIVFRARQRSANRIVALKLIRSDRLSEFDEKYREEVIQRFQSEAQAAAKLEHDHLVTVYEVGEAQGQPFYSMRFVDGKSLAEETRTGPLENVRSARYIRSVAGAVAAAHSQGILHRDLKPHNVIVDRTTDRALVADFGLAKLLDVERSGTQTGELLGSPPYMAPEQTRDASKVTRSADVYGIGATLYHLLTGRPPFQTSSMVETIRQVNEEDPVAPRRLNPNVDPDLETICLKCLEKEPGRRYESAEAIEAEIDRYLLGKPIQARPLGQLGRLRRWARRNPVPAILTSVAFLLATALVVGSSAAYLVTSRALAETEEQRRRADEQADRANQNLAEAARAVDQSLITIANNEQLKRSGMDRLRRSLLESSLPFLEKFVSIDPDDHELMKLKGRALRNLSTVQIALGDLQQVETRLQQSIELFQGLADQDPDDAQRQQELAYGYRELGRFYFDNGQPTECREALEEALKVFSHLHESYPDHPQMLEDYAQINRDLGTLETGRFSNSAAATRFFERTLELRQRAFKDHPNSSVHRLALVGVYRDLCNIAYDRRELDKAQSYVDQGLSLIAGVDETLSSQSEYLITVQDLEYTFGRLALIRLEPGVAVEHMERAVQASQQLLQAQPENPAFHFRWIQHLSTYGFALQQNEDYERAANAMESATQEAQALVEATNLPVYRSVLASTLDARATLFDVTGDPKNALLLHEQAIAIRKELVREFPETITFRGELATSYFNLGRIYDILEQFVEADRAYLAAVSEGHKLVELAPTFDRYRLQLTDALVNLAILYEETGRIEDARKTYLDAIPHLEALPANDPETQYNLAKVHLSLGTLYVKDGQPRLAIDYLNHAVEGFENRYKIVPDDLDAKTLLATTLIDRAKLRGPLGEIDAGKADWKRAAEVCPTILLPELYLQRAQWMLEFGKDPK